MRITLLVQEAFQVAIRHQVDRHKLARLPVAGDLQHRRAGEPAMGEEQVFTKYGAIFGSDNGGNRHARERLKLFK